ncbi:RNA polymerase sigma factor [Thermodesulfobacteriota bacterium]
MSKTGPKIKPEQKKDEDYELIQAITSGEKNLFYDLVKRYEQKLYNFGLKICRDTTDAEDLVQETFLNVFKYLNGFRYETKFKNWLYRIAGSICIKKRRKSKFAPQEELSLDDFIPEKEADIPDKLPQWAALPLDKLLNRELSDIIHQAIRELPEKYRPIIVLRDIEGFSTRDTAQILDLTESNVKVRLHRARLFLKEKLTHYYEQT